MVSIYILIAAIVILLLLITIVKLNAFLSLLLTALFTGFANNMSGAAIVQSIIKGVADTMGPVLPVIALGVMLGSILSSSGAASVISQSLIKAFGVKYTKIAMVITGFSVGIAMFYNAGFIVLMPLAFSVAIQTGLPLVYIVTAMASALSVTHGFLPPHPGPSAIAGIFKADIGKTLLYGIVVSIPCILFAGIFFPETIKKIKSNPPVGLFGGEAMILQHPPGFVTSFMVALMPVVLMGISTFASLYLPQTSNITKWSTFLGQPIIAITITVLLSLLLFAGTHMHQWELFMKSCNKSFEAAVSILLVIAGGGIFKQLLLDSGTGTQIAEQFANSELSPLFLGWLIATFIRIALGSATVAGLTAAGIVAPLIVSTGVRPELMVLSVGAGSLMCSHVNDTGFWMFKEYLGLSVKDTFKTWTVMETIIGITGLAGVFILNSILS